ncbi:hypothetical protein EVAR_84756_1 [Eumeta japonica]|uniref:Uncharacterized protein n=1 Tax=Eumeta variegata TaxID=151549 RepID=A0A4C1U859_EUMVA|nr:hypothetical protein EVAR_84756_1 [Eumeta japonica]
MPRRARRRQAVGPGRCHRICTKLRPLFDEFHKRLRLESDQRRLVVVHDDVVHQDLGFDPRRNQSFANDTHNCDEQNKSSAPHRSPHDVFKVLVTVVIK